MGCQAARQYLGGPAAKYHGQGHPHGEGPPSGSRRPGRRAAARRREAARRGGSPRSAAEARLRDGPPAPSEAHNSAAGRSSVCNRRVTNHGWLPCEVAGMQPAAPAPRSRESVQGQHPPHLDCGQNEGSAVSDSSNRSPSGTSSAMLRLAGRVHPPRRIVECPRECSHPMGARQAVEL